MEHWRKWSPLLVASVVALTGPKDLHGQQLTSADVLSPIGTEYRYLAIGGSEIPWDTITESYPLWDYAWLAVNATNQTTVTAIAPLDIPGTTAFTDADHVLRTVRANDGATTYTIFEQENDRLLDLGYLAPTHSAIASDPSIALGLPMVLGDTLHESWCHEVQGTIGGPAYTYCGNSYVTFDAIGILVLPFGAHINVGHVTRKKTSLWITDTPQDSTFVVEQLWYSQGITQPILVLELTYNSPTSVFVTGRFMDTSFIAAVPTNTAASNLAVHPNPTTGPIVIQHTFAEAATVEVLTMDGRTVFTEAVPSGSLQHALDLTGLVDAPYVLRLRDGATNSSSIVVKCGAR